MGQPRTPGPKAQPGDVASGLLDTWQGPRATLVPSGRAVSPHPSKGDSRSPKLGRCKNPWVGGPWEDCQSPGTTCCLDIDSRLLPSCSSSPAPATRGSQQTGASAQQTLLQPEQGQCLLLWWWLRTLQAQHRRPLCFSRESISPHIPL